MNVNEVVFFIFYLLRHGYRDICGGWKISAPKVEYTVWGGVYV